MKISTPLVLVPVAVAAAILAVANREEVVFKLDPFVPADAAVGFAMPLFLLVFSSFLLGVLVGGATMALRKGRNARRKRTQAKDIANALAMDTGKPATEPPPS